MTQPNSNKNRPPHLVHMTTIPATLNFVAGQVENAKRHGFDVQAISAPDDEFAKFGARVQIDIHPLPMARRITPLQDLVTLWRLTRLLRRLRPDIVHGHTPKGGLLAMIGSWLSGVPVRVYHIHGLPMLTASGVKRFLLRWSEKVSCMLASQVYCVSPSVRDVAVAEGLCRADKIKVLHNGTIDGIDAENVFNPALVGTEARREIHQALGIPADAQVIGFVGRIVRDKGIVELAEAWRKLRAEFPKLHLLVIGPFEGHDPAPADVENLLRTDERIHLAGLINIMQMPRYYSAIDLLVLPTYREGFNTAILEAAAMQVPAVASKVPGCTEGIVDGETGAFCPPRDPVALAEALRGYLQDDERRRQHGIAGRERVLRDFHPDDLCAAIFDEYLRLLRENGVDVPTPQRESVCV